MAIYALQTQSVINIHYFCSCNKNTKRFSYLSPQWYEAMVHPIDRYHGKKNEEGSYVSLYFFAWNYCQKTQWRVQLLPVWFGSSDVGETILRPVGSTIIFYQHKCSKEFQPDIHQCCHPSAFYILSKPSAFSISLSVLLCTNKTLRQGGFCGYLICQLCLKVKAKYRHIHMFFLCRALSQNIFSEGKICHILMRQILLRFKQPKIANAIGQPYAQCSSRGVVH